MFPRDLLLLLSPSLVLCRRRQRAQCLFLPHTSFDYTAFFLDELIALVVAHDCRFACYTAASNLAAFGGVLREIFGLALGGVC